MMIFSIKKIMMVAALIGVLASGTNAQDIKSYKSYHPEDNAAAKIKEAVKEAKATGKNIFIQAGGNWCIWCLRFENFVKEDRRLDSIMNANYVVYHLNYSPENENKAIFKKYGFPQRFGFPVFLILDEKGKLIHTQDSGLLEEDKSYNKKNVETFLRNWAPAALSEKTYKE